MALSVVYFRITHRLGRPHYVWNEYLYSVREKVEVRVIVSVTVCVVLLCVWDDDNERKGEGETWCRLIACSSQKAPRGPPGLTSPSDGWIAINSTICLPNIHTADGFGIKSRIVMYNLAIRKCTSPPLLAPTLEMFKLILEYPAGDRTPDLLKQRQTCYQLFTYI